MRTGHPGQDLHGNRPGTSVEGRHPVIDQDTGSTVSSHPRYGASVTTPRGWMSLSLPPLPHLDPRPVVSLIKTLID